MLPSYSISLCRYMQPGRSQIRPVNSSPCQLGITPQPVGSTPCANGGFKLAVNGQPAYLCMNATSSSTTSSSSSSMTMPVMPVMPVTPVTPSVPTTPVVPAIPVTPTVMPSVIVPVMPPTVSSAMACPTPTVTCTGNVAMDTQMCSTLASSQAVPSCVAPVMQSCLQQCGVLPATTTSVGVVTSM